MLCTVLRSVSLGGIIPLEMITGGNTKPGDWYEDLCHDPDSQEEFSKEGGTRTSRMQSTASPQMYLIIHILIRN